MLLVSELALMINAIEVVTPVIATWTVLLQVLADTDPVLVVKVVFATMTTVPATVGVAAGKSPAAIAPNVPTPVVAVACRTCVVVVSEAVSSMMVPVYAGWV
jgi:hypothetical protein